MIPDWFRVDCDIVDSPKVGRLADALKISDAQAIGHVIAVYSNVRYYGSFVGVVDRTIEQWALWQGRRGRFAEAFRVEFVRRHGRMRTQGVIARPAQRPDIRQSVRRRLLALSGEMCPICFELYDDGRHRRHIDHVVPYSIVGDHEESNLRVICALCNWLKGAREEVPR